jgi:hypothetical protein
MKRYSLKRGLLAAAITLVVGALAIYIETRTHPEPNPEELTDINDIEALRAQFNRDAGHTRLILLLSPT